MCFMAKVNPNMVDKITYLTSSHLQHSQIHFRILTTFVGNPQFYPGVSELSKEKKIVWCLMTLNFSFHKHLFFEVLYINMIFRNFQSSH